jgi:hypothetical protein
MTTLSSLIHLISGTSAFVAVFAFAFLLVVFLLAIRSDYQKTSFMCRLFGFTIETKMKGHKHSE